MRIVTFGEAMLRFSPPRESSIEKAPDFVVETAGAEANVAVALARLGIDAAWVSRLPRNPLGRRVATSIRAHGVDISGVIWTDHGRAGLYFVDEGFLPRPFTVVYDREGSAFSQIQPGEVGQDALEAADLLHVTGITPALSPGARAVTLDMVHSAHERGVGVSYDLNYRAKLWSPEEARVATEEILPLASLFFLASRDAVTVLGVDGSPEQQIEKLADRYPGATIVLTAGEEGAWAWDGRVHHRGIVRGVEVDRIGRGDALCAGFIFGQQERGTAYGLACGTALAALTQTYAGDFVWSTREDLLAVVDGVSSGHFR